MFVLVLCAYPLPWEWGCQILLRHGQETAPSAYSHADYFLLLHSHRVNHKGMVVPIAHDKIKYEIKQNNSKPHHIKPAEGKETPEQAQESETHSYTHSGVT